MARNARHRIDPKTGEQRPEQQVGELHLIELFAENGRVGFFCDEGVQFRNPSSVVVQGVSPVDPFETVIKAYSEISILGEPTDEEYWVDYDQPGFRATTFVNFNPSEVGKYARITYHGLGTVVHPRYFEERTETFRGNGEYTEDLTVQGDTDLQGQLRTGGTVSLAEDSAAEIQLNAKRAQNAANPIDQQDLVTKSYLEEVSLRFAIFLVNGSFVVPDGVEKLLVEIAGGGGGGGGGFDNTVSAAGGGGGGESKNIAEYTVTPGETIAITIGTGGSAGNSGSSPTSGGTGGSSVFGSYITQLGGAGGIGGGLSDSGRGGLGNGNFASDGFNSEGSAPSRGGNGGGCGGRGGCNATSNGENGKSGGGGGGGFGTVSGGTSAAGTGGGGYVKIFW